MITDFTRGRMLAPPVLKKPAKSYDDMDFWIVRYRQPDPKKYLYFADDPEEYLEVTGHITKRFHKPNSGMYASNSVYHHRHTTISEQNQPDNVRDYLGMIDIDKVLGNEEVGRELIRGFLERLPDEGVWCLISGSGVHIKINGFRSHLHATSFIAARGIERGPQPTPDSPIKVDLLNDVSRIGTVPFEVYKKDKGVLCFPFMPEELDDVFDRPDWRSYYRSSITMPWHLPPANDVVAWNERTVQLVPKRMFKRTLKSIDLHEDIDEIFWKSLPPCIERAFHQDVSDGRMRIIQLLSAFLNRLGIDEWKALDLLIIRGATFSHPMDPSEVMRIQFGVIDRNLEPTGCKKVRSLKGEMAFPYQNLGKLDLCPYGADDSRSCKAQSPWKMFKFNKWKIQRKER